MTDAPAIDIDELEQKDGSDYEIAVVRAAPELIRLARLAATQADEIAALRAERDEAITNHHDALADERADHAEEIAALRVERDEAVNELDQMNGVHERAQLAEANLASARALLVTAEEAMEPVRKRAQFLDETPDEITHWHPAVGSPVTAGDIRRLALVAADIARATRTGETGE